MASDSSSSEEDKDRFIEALDSHFLPQDIFTKSENAAEAKNKSLPSLRKNTLEHKSEQINPFTIKVTPEFQKYVSKHLSNLLDKSIKDTKRKSKCTRKKTKLSGIKLLSSSKCYLQPGHPIGEVALPTRRPKQKNSSTKDLEEKAKEVAVSAEWILSQKETKFWAPNNKGEVEILNCNIRNA